MVIVSMELGFLLSTKVASLNGIGQLFLSKISLLFIYLFIVILGTYFNFVLRLRETRKQGLPSIPKRHIGPDYSMLSLSFHVCSQSPASFCILPGCPHISALFLGETLYYCFLAEYQISVYDLQQNSKSSHFCY